MCGRRENEGNVQSSMEGKVEASRLLSRSHCADFAEIVGVCDCDNDDTRSSSAIMLLLEGRTKTNLMAIRKPGVGDLGRGD
jgi:hypothetical protein